MLFLLSMAKGKGLFSFFGRDKISYQKLAKLNLAVAAILGLQALAILIMSDSGKGIVGITSNYLNNDLLRRDGAGQDVWLPASQHLFDLHLSYVVAALLLVVAFSRLLAGNFKRKKYDAGLKRGPNKHSWVEHGAMVTLLMGTVALLSGIVDVVSLFFVFWLAGTISWLGYKFEVYSIKNKVTDWQLFAVMLKSGVWIWLVILVYAAGALIWGRGLPVYLYFIYGSVFIIGAGFSYNTYQSFKKAGRSSDRLWGERVYLGLTVLAVSALAWQVFFGTLR
jgi:Heliorhodopsin